MHPRWHSLLLGRWANGPKRPLNSIDHPLFVLVAIFWERSRRSFVLSSEPDCSICADMCSVWFASRMMLSRAQEIVLEALRVPNSIDLAPPSRAPASVANLKSFLRLLSYDRVVLYCRALSRLFCLSAASSARHLAITLQSRRVGVKQEAPLCNLFIKRQRVRRCVSLRRPASATPGRDRWLFIFCDALLGCLILRVLCSS